LYIYSPTLTTKKTTLIYEKMDNFFFFFFLLGKLIRNNVFGHLTNLLFFLINYSQVIGKDLFKVVREKLGENLESFIFEKVIVVPGDVSDENLGVGDSKQRQDMWKEIYIILNSAATTTFDER
jgi:hypothetical protein